ncbi:MAG: hypothetical protein IJ685_07850 [Selenomonadaceae bacterium]|nr:hypothetical protein [Selenomonadaceae bacterium]
MNERGFVTIFALCLILVIALVVKGIQESNTNYNYGAADLQTEFDLQNAADGGIYEAAELVRSGKKNLSANVEESLRKNYQKQLVNRSIKTARGTISVKVWGERLKIQNYKRLYPSYAKEKVGAPKYGYILFSVAQFDNKRTNGKVYRRAFAWVVDGYGYEYYNGTKAKFGYKKVEPKPEDEIVGDEGDAPVFDPDLNKFLVVVKPEDKDVVHFMELPSSIGN